MVSRSRGVAEIDAEMAEEWGGANELNELSKECFYIRGDSIALLSPPLSLLPPPFLSVIHSP